jgi:hypothetical protein
MQPSLCSDCGSCDLGNVSPFHCFATWGHSGNKGGGTVVYAKNRAPRFKVQITVLRILQQMMTSTAAAGHRRPERKFTHLNTGS